MVGCAPVLLLAWGESGLPADLDRPVKELLSNWTRKRNAIYCGPKLIQQDLWFHPNMQNANRKRNSRCYKDTCHEQAFVPDALQILPLIFTVTLKPDSYYLEVKKVGWRHQRASEWSFQLTCGAIFVFILHLFPPGWELCKSNNLKECLMFLPLPLKA